MNEEAKSIIAEMTSSTNPREVSLNDTILVGCNGCGNCCMNAQMRLNAFDIYNIVKKVGMKKASDHMAFYFGDNSHLPIIGLFASKETNMCPYLQATNDGDYKCILEDSKPSTCTHPFVAIGTKFTQSEFNFVPLDQKVQSFDIEQYLKDYDISKNIFYYVEDRSNQCPSTCKKNVLVSDYMSDRIKYSREHNLAIITSMLLSKYIKVNELTRLLYLADNSKENKHIKSFLGEMSSYDKITRSMFIDAYLYTDIESSKSFEEQTIEHIKYLEKKKYPVLRLLYKYFYVVFDPGHVTLESILNTDDIDLAQERFDNYFASNVEQIKDRFYNQMIVEMAKEMKELNL